MKKARITQPTNLVMLTSIKPFQTSPSGLRKCNNKTILKETSINRTFDKSAGMSATNDFLQAKSLNLRSRPTSENAKSTSVYTKPSTMCSRRSTGCSTTNPNPLKPTRPSTVPPLTYSEAYTSLDDDATKPSWSKILQHRTAYYHGHILDTCDPLRSLHFLIEEFCSKISSRLNINKGHVASNGDLERMLSNIREIMVRIPHNSQNSADSNRMCAYCHKMKKKMDHKSCQTSEIKVFKLKAVNKSSQTLDNLVISSTHVNYLEKQLESRLKIIEDKHFQLETENNELRDENKALQETLAKHNEELNNVRTEMDINEKVYHDEKSKFLEEIYTLSAQLEKMKQYQEKVEEMKDVTKRVTELALHNKILESELEQANKETIQAQLKYEKMCVIIENREKQLVKLHQEFSNIQEIVNSNNIDNVKLFSSSSPSNNTDPVISESWGIISSIPTHEDSLNSKIYDKLDQTSKQMNQIVPATNIMDPIAKMSFVDLPSDISDCTIVSEIIEISSNTNIGHTKEGAKVRRSEPRNIVKERVEFNFSTGEGATMKRYRGTDFK